MPKKKEALEEQEQIAFVNWLRIEGIDFFSVPNENLFMTLLKKYLPKNLVHLINALEAKLKRMGKKKGVSDLVVLLETKIMFIEMKREESGSLSKEQKSFLAMANEYEYAVGVVAHGWQEAKALVEYYRSENERGMGIDKK